MHPSLSLLFCSAAFFTSLTLAQTISPNNTCGIVEAGAGNGFLCPSDLPCCSSHGFCGATDAYCLTSLGCQFPFSNPSTSSCRAPVDKVTPSPDGTCGMTGAGVYGYRCPLQGFCCSE